MFFLTKAEQKLNTRQFFKHRYLQYVLAKLATAEGTGNRPFCVETFNPLPFVS